MLLKRPAALEWPYRLWYSTRLIDHANTVGAKAGVLEFSAPPKQLGGYAGGGPVHVMADVKANSPLQ
jgi:hypothetical protein